MDDFQSVNSGNGSLKDFYDESAYEAVRRRRKKSLEKTGLQTDDDSNDRETVKKPITGS